MDFDFEDIFNQFSGFSGFGDIFGEQRGGQRRSQSRGDYGEDIKVNLTLTFEEAVFGTTKDISYEKIERCEKCEGTGAEGAKLKTCSQCKGSGATIREQRTPFGTMRMQTTCRTCNGRGEVAENSCSACSGQGFVRSTANVSVKIPAGVNTGNHLRLQNKGNQGRDGAGDLYVIIFVHTHEVFKRDGEDIYAEVPLSFAEAALGSEIEVPTLQGKADLKIPAGTQTGTIFKMKGKGIKSLKSESHGDEYVKVIIETPKKLSKRQKEILEEFLKDEGAAKKRKGFFDKIFGKD